MIHFFDPWRDIGFLSMALRMVLALICGGAVGIERSMKHRPAGFRTHILICLGSCMSMTTGEFLFYSMHQYTDIGRLGAQVVAGIGFIGAGSIIVSKNRRVRGLTTAAGLWASAIAGLAIGAGFFEGAIILTLLIVVAERFFATLEYRVMNDQKTIGLLVEYDDINSLNRVLAYFKDMHMDIVDLEIHKGDSLEDAYTMADISIDIYRKLNLMDLVRDIKAIRGVRSVSTTG